MNEQRRERDWTGEPPPKLPAPPFEVPPGVPLTLVDGCVLRVGKTRVSLASVAHCYGEGYSAEEIQEAFPSLDLAELYRILAFYVEHREVVDAFLKEQSDLMEGWAERSGLKERTRRLFDEGQARMAQRRAAAG